MSTPFEIIMIKPSHYDDDGYPITFWRNFLPSNTLATLNGIARDCAARQVLGPDVEIVPVAMDETNRHIIPEKIIADVKARGVKAMVAMVGVQSNQFFRALDIAAPFRAAGIPVCIGGFHVSGCFAMLPDIQPEFETAWSMGVSLFAGESEEGRFDDVVRDGWAGTLKPLYNHLGHLPSLSGAPVPMLAPEAIRRTLGQWSSFDLGRGCPYSCSFCTIINVQGRKSRFRTPDDLEAIIRQNHAQGIKAFFITDDNLVRNHDWEAFFDRLIALRAEGLGANMAIQVDTLCHRTPGFIEKAVAAGVNRVFIGLENINPDNLESIGKRQNRITEYRAMVQAWQNRGVFTFAGYIIGFPGDTKASVIRDVEIIKRELPLDVLEFFFLTPLPGSEDHQRMMAAGEWLDPDLNKYNLHHRVSHHPHMSDAEWEAAYDAAWQTYYTPEHIETVSRRHARLPKGRPAKAAQYLNEFRMIYTIEGLHPLEGGVFRLKRRKARRPGMPVEPVWRFYPRFAVETASKLLRYARAFLQERAIVRRVKGDPARFDYTDIAVQPPGEEFDELGLFTATSGGDKAVALHRQRAGVGLG